MSASSKNAGSDGSTEAIHLPAILVVDDDDQIVKQVTWALAGEYRVLSAPHRPAALELFEREDVHVVLLDLGLPPHPREASEGLQALEEFLEIRPLAKVIIVSGNSERQHALKAFDKGAHDIFPKPVDVDALKVVLERACRRVELEKEIFQAKTAQSQDDFLGIIGSSAPMQAVFSTLRKVAPADIPVLILGESGTGKELVAQAIHGMSSRSQQPFVAINCAGIPESLIESELFGYEKGAFTGATMQRKGRIEFAQGGTLFLDEIGDLSPPLQVKLLRFLQEKVIERVGGREPIAVDCRIVAATHRDLDLAVQEGSFREDLFFRLAVVKCNLPPLRERGDDILRIAERYAMETAKDLQKAAVRFSREALDALRRHSWPGNVRELQNRVRRAVVLADSATIGTAELELDSAVSRQPAVGSLKEAREELEKEMVARALAENKGNISRTARVLGISRPTLYELIARHGL